MVREHHAPVGALRRCGVPLKVSQVLCQGAPRTCRCIETSSCRSGGRRVSMRQGAPRTCRCIETSSSSQLPQRCQGQGAPRTCRCIETTGRPRRQTHTFRCQGAPRTCRCIELFSPRVVARGRCGGCCLLRGSGGAGFSNGGVPRPHRRARWARIGFGGGSPGGEPFPGGPGSFGGVSRSVVAPVTSWGSCSAAPGPAGEAAPNRLLRLFLSATPFHPPLRSFFPYSRG